MTYPNTMIPSPCGTHRDTLQSKIAGKEVRAPASFPTSDVGEEGFFFALGVEPQMLAKTLRSISRFGLCGDHGTGARLSAGLAGVLSTASGNPGSCTDLTANIVGSNQDEGTALPGLSAMGDCLPSPPRSASASDTDATARVRHRILVVDDNTDAARSLARVLTVLHGRLVEVAHDGPSALERAEVFRPQLILLDIGLPGMTGYEVAMHLCNRPWFSDSRLVAVTGWGLARDRALSKAAGFHHHLVKPVKNATLLQLLDGTLPLD